jgi:hypothetical protein
METVKHTPGPWMIETPKTGGRFITGKGFPVASLTGHHVDDWDGNARLIAAAPELLEACQYALGHLLDNEKYTGDDVLWSCVSHFTRAIAKATASESGAV